MNDTFKSFSSCAILLGLIGCAPHAEPGVRLSDYRTVAADVHHDTDTATAQNEIALAQLDKSQLDPAEQSARAALTADVGFGPAHNTLGMIYYRRGALYLAAWEFQYAIKLMPRQAGAPNNLGLVYEAGAKWDQAVDAYAAALKLAPADEQILGNLARARWRRGDRDADERTLLMRVVADDRPAWSLWARQQLARLPTATSKDADP